MSTKDMTTRPPWEAKSPRIAVTPTSVPADPATVTSGDIGHFEALLAGSPDATTITPAQIADVQLVVQEALQQGQDTSCLDPTAPPHDRLRAFRALVEPAIKQGRVREVTLADDGLIQALYVATYGWGPMIQPLLDDPHVWEIKIGGTWAIAEGAHGRQVLTQPYESSAIPLSRIQVLAQTQGIRLDREHASETIPLPHKTRLHVTIPPLLPDDDLLVVIRRGRRQPWGLTDLVQRQALSSEGAVLLDGLLQSWPSIIFSGAQNSGKTTAMECAINALPSDLHHVLIEDHVDELRLHAHTLTRLQRTERTGSGAAGMWRMLREILRMTPDYLIPVEIRTDEASAVLELARIGRPVLTTLHEDTPSGALERFALRAATATTPENPFAGQLDAARQTLTRVFDLVVHLTWSRRHWRRLVSSVHVLNGVDTAGQPRLIPLIEAVPTEDDHDLTWVCHAELADGRLVWRDGGDHTPERLARRLADVPSTTVSVAPKMTTVQDIPTLLADVQQALVFPQQTEDILTRLATALARDAEHPTVWQQAQQALDSHAGVQGWASEQVQAHLTQLQQSLQQRDIAAAHTVLTNTKTQPVLHLALTREPQWRSAVDELTTLEQLIQSTQSRLQEVATLGTQGQYADALVRLQNLIPEALPADLARQVVTAQQWVQEALAASTASQPPSSVAMNQDGSWALSQDVAADQVGPTQEPPNHSNRTPIPESIPEQHSSGQIPTSYEGTSPGQSNPSTVTNGTPTDVVQQVQGPPNSMISLDEVTDDLIAWKAYGDAIRRGTTSSVVSDNTDQTHHSPQANPSAVDLTPMTGELPVETEVPAAEVPDDATTSRPVIPMDTTSADDVGDGLTTMVDEQFLDQWRRRD